MAGLIGPAGTGTRRLVRHSPEFRGVFETFSSITPRCLQRLFRGTRSLRQSGIAGQV